MNMRATMMIFSSLAMCACHSDQDQAERWQLERERVELGQDLALKQYRLEQSSFKDLGTLMMLSSSNLLVKQKIQLLLGERAHMEEEIRTAEAALVSVHERFLREQRRKAIGTTFESITVADGRHFSKATVSAIDDAGVTIRHRDGSARLQFVDLDEQQRHHFGMDAERSMAAEDVEKKRAFAYEKWIDAGVAMNQQSDKAAMEQSRREDQLERSQRLSAIAEQASVSHKERPLAQAAKSFGSMSSRYIWRYNGGYNRPRGYRYVYYNTIPSSYCNSDHHSNSAYRDALLRDHQKTFYGTANSTDP